MLGEAGRVVVQGEHSASCLDMLMIRIQTAHRKFTYFLSISGHTAFQFFEEFKTGS
jgi:hypothetical protein